jgi:hypothetical protein
MKNKKSRQSLFVKNTYAGRLSSPLAIFVVCLILFIPVLFIACDYSKPGEIYDPSMKLDTAGKPAVTGFTPSLANGGAVPGVREIRINGRNFTSSDWVSIGGVSATIKSVQSNVITIYRPSLSNDHYDKAINVSVINPKKYTADSSSTYVVGSPGAFVGDYSTSNFTQALTSFEFDKQENIYMGVANKNVIKIDFAGVTQTTGLSQGNLLSGSYANITSLSYGPGVEGRNMYIAVGQNTISRIAVFDTLNRVGSKYTTPVKLTVPSAVYAIEFDEKGNLYAAGNAGLYVADSSVGQSAAPAFATVSGYSGVTNVKGLRWVKTTSATYLYIADSMHVWKGQLNSTNALTMNAPVVDLTGVTDTTLRKCYISSMEVDINGNILLCLKNYPNYSLFFVESNGSLTPYYNNTTILPSTLDKLLWGNDRSPNPTYLYLMSSSINGLYTANRVYRMSMDRAGAPHQGRKFIVQ